MAPLSPALSDKEGTVKKNDQNFIEWCFRLKPGEKKNIPFSFSVEYPKGQAILGLQ